MTGRGVAAFAAAALLSSPLLAQVPQSSGIKEAALETYEPNTLGFTHDSDDDTFLDMKLSLRYPLLPNRFRKIFHDSELSFAATVRFAQYLGTRESSPVIGKRFNPKLIWRRLLPNDNYVDFAYAHESNGQSITTPEEFAFEVQRQAAVGNRPDAAKDFISRGWDYLELASKHTPREWRSKESRGQLAVYTSFRYFLEEGLLQGQAEEYNAWENDPEGKPRKEVQGIAVFLKREKWWDDRNARLTGAKLGFGWETGYAKPFRYNTFRLEGRADLFELPLLVFYQNGYNSDLAQYYKRVSTIGIALELGTSRR
jgi:hypothetical protein